MPKIGQNSIDLKKKTKSNQKIYALPSAHSNSNSSESKHPAAISTPRTRSRLVKYRNEKQGSLKLSPIDGDSIQKAYSESRPKSPNRLTKKVIPTNNQKIPKTPKYPNK